MAGVEKLSDQADLPKRPARIADVEISARTTRHHQDRKIGAGRETRRASSARPSSSIV